MPSNNNGLYFITGALVVAVMVMAGFYFYEDGQGQDVIKETNTVIEKTFNGKDKEDTKSSYEFSVDDDGVSATSESSE